MSNLANLLDDTGRTVQAVGMYEMALDILRQMDQPRLLGVCLGNLGIARKQLGRLDAAYSALSESIGILVKLEARLAAGAFLALRGELLLLLGETNSAESDLLEAEELLKAPHAAGFRAQYLLPLKVRLFAQAGDHSEAASAMDAVLDEMGELDPASEIARAAETCRKILQAARDGKLLNGHIPKDLPRELRRAAAQRLRKSAPDVSAVLDASI